MGVYINEILRLCNLDLILKVLWARNYTRPRFRLWHPTTLPNLNWYDYLLTHSSLCRSSRFNRSLSLD